MLASLAARDLSTLLTGLTRGLLCGVISKVISGNVLFLQKHDKCYQMQVMVSIWLPYAPMVNGDGLFLKRGSDVSDGAGLLLGRNRPFKNIPVLRRLL